MYEKKIKYTAILLCVIFVFPLSFQAVHFLSHTHHKSQTDYSQYLDLKDNNSSVIDYEKTCPVCKYEIVSFSHTDFVKVTAIAAPLAAPS